MRLGQATTTKQHRKIPNVPGRSYEGMALATVSRLRSRQRRSCRRKIGCTCKCRLRRPPLAFEASFAALCGVSPVEASSGKTHRGEANAALHRIVISRLRWDPRARD